jgi:MFS family permease
LLTTTAFPEIVEAVEKTELYSSYDRDSVNIYMSGCFIMLSSIGQALGTFLGSTAADTLGYTWSFIAAGIFTFCFCISYILICGSGQETDIELPKQETELHKRDSV